jgi:hypothetical protein
MLKKILLTAAALTASTAALAHDGWRHEHRYHPYHSYYYAPRPVYVVPAPRVVYAPYYAAPVVVRPAPVYRPVPVYPGVPGISVRFNFPL